MKLERQGSVVLQLAKLKEFTVNDEALTNDASGQLARSVDATLILADFAQVAEGKLTIVGGGWTVIGPKVGPTAIAVDLEVPWDQANLKKQFRLELVDEDGKPVVLNGDPVTVGGQFEVGRPPGHPRGAPLSWKFAVNLGPMPIPPGGRWAWRLVVDDTPVAQRAFQTRPGK